MKMCSMDGCDRKHYAKGLCKNHYHEKRANDDPILREKNRVRSLNWYNLPSSKASQRARLLLSRRNMTVETYDEMLKSQGGKCCICGTSQEDVGEHMAVDHDHSCCGKDKSCGKCTRGLLCNKCNTGLGSFNDSGELLINAIGYLKNYQDKHKGV